MSNDSAEQGKIWLKQVLQHCGMEADVTADPPAFLPEINDFGGSWLTIDPESLSGEQLEMLTSRGATVLDALQYLLTSTLNLKNNAENREAFTLELGSLRADRYLELSQIAKEAAEQVRTSGEEYEMPPLTSAERRLVHTLHYDTDVQTESRGEEPDRRLGISLADTLEDEDIQVGALLALGE